MVNRAVNAITDDLPKGFELKDVNLQAHTPIDIPNDTLREAIVNALMHRSFRVNRPIQIIRYSNRLEISNPGFSLKSPEHLGKPGSELRNSYGLIIELTTIIVELTDLIVELMEK